MSTFVNTHYRPQYAQSTQQQSTSRLGRTGPTVTDDYERWYTESSHSNRMLLSLRSGIDAEVGWALDRLCRLCDNDQFILSSIPGLADALFEWPEWYALEGHKEKNSMPSVFAADPAASRRRRHALESLFILRNAALNEHNALIISQTGRVAPLISAILQTADVGSDSGVEFALYAIELLHAFSQVLILPAPPSTGTNSLVASLENIAANSSNRTLIVAALLALTDLFGNPANAAHVMPNSPSLQAAIRYLPLFKDPAMVEVCINYLYAHLSHGPSAVAFLHHPEMAAVLKLLVTWLISQQVEEPVTVDIGGTVHTASSSTQTTRDHELTKDELNNLLEKPEPQRCYEWMKTMFVAKADGELTQVDFWNLYKDIFMPYQERFPLLVASDVIKNVNFVFPQAQAMVLQGPSPRFVVRGVDRRRETVTVERFQCHWDRSACTTPPFSSPGSLYDHILEHLKDHESPSSCLWSTCSRGTDSSSSLRSHILTHISNSQPLQKDPSQSDTITLPSEDSPYPIPDPTSRPPPPPRKTEFTYKRPIQDPPHSALTGLLCIRVLFRVSFASEDAAPRVDADHFGFPGVVEEVEGEQVVSSEASRAKEKAGARRGKQAFVGAVKLLESVQIRDDTLMSWIMEMIDASMPATQ
ncbi:hypothetical protein HGRIS_008227 [Hohenbuehelia grisea]|uniref:RFX-type winged-helix domain-containing protein n=1 Tax=Hohenbuehelia grisea TaxID=104357 RepID=A0ABR3J7C4_9AGAR